MVDNEEPDDKPSVIDALNDDASPEEYPEGAPVLRSWLQIRPRSKRAEFKRKFGEFNDMRGAIDKAQKAAKRADVAAAAGKDVQGELLKLSAQADDMYQLMDDLMRMAAVNEDYYSKWSDDVDDADLVATFNVFVKRSQPGEASSSAT